MRVFDHPNFNKNDKNDGCLVCHTQDDKPVILVGIVGTEKEHIMQAKQVHIDCINLLYYPEMEALAQKL